MDGGGQGTSPPLAQVSGLKSRGYAVTLPPQDNWDSLKIVFHNNEVSESVDSILRGFFIYFAKFENFQITEV